MRIWCAANSIPRSAATASSISRTTRRPFATWPRWSAPGGRVVILVPAHPSLMGPLDEKLGHWRRYTRRMMAERLQAAGLEVESIRFMNFVGACGWYVAGHVFRQSTIKNFHVRMHKIIQPIAQTVERILFRIRPPFGLSIIGVGRKPLFSAELAPVSEIAQASEMAQASEIAPASEMAPVSEMAQAGEIAPADEMAPPKEAAPPRDGEQIL